MLDKNNVDSANDSIRLASYLSARDDFFTAVGERENMTNWNYISLDVYKDMIKELYKQLLESISETPTPNGSYLGQKIYGPDKDFIELEILSPEEKDTFWAYEYKSVYDNETEYQNNIAEENNRHNQIIEELFSPFDEANKATLYGDGSDTSFDIVIALDSDNIDDFMNKNIIIADYTKEKAELEKRIGEILKNPEQNDYLEDIQKLKLLKMMKILKK